MRRIGLVLALVFLLTQLTPGTALAFIQVPDAIEIKATDPKKVIGHVTVAVVVGAGRGPGTVALGVFSALANDYVDGNITVQPRQVPTPAPVYGPPKPPPDPFKQPWSWIGHTLGKVISYLTPCPTCALAVVGR